MNTKHFCLILIAILLLSISAEFAQSSESPAETDVWKLERVHWEDIKSLDLVSFRALWHPNFVGWPSASAMPERKAHITDWITANTEKGLHLKSYILEPAASQATGNIVVVHYWLTALWADKNDQGAPRTLRVTHVWIREGKSWQIIDGMSSPEKEVRK